VNGSLSWVLDVKLQAAARQRSGRAGRVRPGICYALFTRDRYESLRPYQVSYRRIERTKTRDADWGCAFGDVSLWLPSCCLTQWRGSHLLLEELALQICYVYQQTCELQQGMHCTSNDLKPFCRRPIWCGLAG
jgi:hypothetical protein